MLKIGDFSSLTQVSVKTLRFYDETGLLRPVHVDPDSGYRYYSASQLPRLYRILAVKDLGFPLEQVGKALAEGISPEQLRGMLLLREAEQENRVREEAERLGRLKARLRLIEQETLMNTDVVIKEAAPQWFGSVREVIPAYAAVGTLFGEVYGMLGRHARGGLPAALWHDGEYKERDVDAEAGVFLKEKVPGAGRVEVRQLPAATVASIVHNGAYQRLGESYDAVLRWIEANGYRVAGPIRELYLQCSQPVRQDDESYITEIQVPVAK